MNARSANAIPDLIFPAAAICFTIIIPFAFTALVGAIYTARVEIRKLQGTQAAPAAEVSQMAISAPNNAKAPSFSSNSSRPRLGAIVNLYKALVGGWLP